MRLTRHSLERRLGCYNPPKPETYRNKGEDQAVAKATAIREMLKTINPGDWVQLATKADRGKLAAFHALGRIAPTGTSRYRSLMIRGLKHRTKADQQFMADYEAGAIAYNSAECIEVENLPDSSISVIRPAMIDAIARRI